MQLLTYLNFPGTCRDAFAFYEQHLGGKVTSMMTHGDAPPGSQSPPNWGDKILHARMTLGGTELLGADIPNAQPMRSAYLTLLLDSIDEAERVFATLREGGETFMPIQETFFAQRFAMLRDRFGTSWMLIHERSRG